MKIGIIVVEIVFIFDDDNKIKITLIKDNDIIISVIGSIIVVDKTNENFVLNIIIIIINIKDIIINKIDKEFDKLIINIIIIDGRITFIIC